MIRASGVAIAPQDLENFNVESNEFEGPIPDAVGGLLALDHLAVSYTWIGGAIPEALASLLHLTILEGWECRFTGTLPESMWTLFRLDFMALTGETHVVTTLPSSLGPYLQLSSVKLMGFPLAGLSGFLACGARMRYLDDLQFFRCHLRGTLPESITIVRRLARLALGSNGLAGSIPDLVGALKKLRDLYLADNQLQGAVPGVVHRLRKLRVVDMSRNELVGALPALLALAGYLMAHNSLTGTLPEDPQFWHRLGALSLEDNRLRGAVPSLGPQMVTLYLGGRNGLEGLLPASIGHLQELEVLDISRMPLHGADDAGLHGSLSAVMGRNTKLRGLLVQWNSLRGAFPRLASTLKALVVYENELASLNDVPLDRSGRTKVFMHNNKLTCDLPSCGGIPCNISIVGVGNHLSRPQHFPPWIDEHDKAGLFWVPPGSGIKFLAKNAAGLLAFSMALCRGWHRVIGALWRLEQRSGGELSNLRIAARELMDHMLWQAILSYMIAASALSTVTMRCPPWYVELSAVYCESVAAHALVVLSWRQACYPTIFSSWWMRETEHAEENRASAVKQLAHWWLWVPIVCLLSSAGVLQVAAKCVPSLLGLQDLALQGISAFMGVSQSLVSAVLIPRLARLFSSAHPANLEGFGYMLTSCVLPLGVMFVLDGRCMSGWTRHWEPCSGKSSSLEIYSNVGLSLVEQNFADRNLKRIMSKAAICRAQGSFLPSTCLQAVLTKWQDLVLSKLVIDAWSMPAGRMMASKLFTKSREVAMALARVLVLSLISGRLLPLSAPLMLQVACASYVLLALSAEEAVFRVTKDAGVSSVCLRAGMYCSATIHVISVSKDQHVLPLLLLGIVLLTVGRGSQLGHHSH